MSLEELLRLLVKRGGEMYSGEPVTQLMHGLQCAHLAQRAQEPSSLIAAALLHDLGYLLEDADVPGAERRHELRAAQFLGRWFGPDVIEPISLHVAAKRYLCATEPSYWGTLSGASRTSLKVQGGAYSEEQAKDFIAMPHAPESVRLRRYDDLAKIPGLSVPPAEDYLGILQQVSHCG
jgi:[1-hydroxy-2-(trimethylamino)ethyl]phosphonate dioxygenase